MKGNKIYKPLIRLIFIVFLSGCTQHASQGLLQSGKRTKRLEKL